MASPYRSSVAYRGQSFVAVTAPKGVNIKGAPNRDRKIGLTPEEKEALNGLYSWKKEEDSSK
jgi:hypothetical protein